MPSHSSKSSLGGVCSPAFPDKPSMSTDCQWDVLPPCPRNEDRKQGAYFFFFWKVTFELCDIFSDPCGLWNVQYMQLQQKDPNCTRCKPCVNTLGWPMLPRIGFCLQQQRTAQSFYYFPSYSEAPTNLSTQHGNCGRCFLYYMIYLKPIQSQFMKSRLWSTT